MGGRSGTALAPHTMTVGFKGAQTCLGLSPRQAKILARARACGGSCWLGSQDMKSASTLQAVGLGKVEWFPYALFRFDVQDRVDYNRAAEVFMRGVLVDVVADQAHTKRMAENAADLVLAIQKHGPEAVVTALIRSGVSWTTLGAAADAAGRRVR